MAKALPFFTIGHSTRSIEQFIALLRLVKIKIVVDIRTIPKSRTNPQYNGDTLAEYLSEVDIQYTQIEALGGLRNKSQHIPAEVNGFWQNQSFHNYADYALTNDFQLGLQQLVSLGTEQVCAIMCAEAVWWRCHRRIVADYLLANGKEVFHLMATDKIEAAKLTQGGEITEDNLVKYPQ